MEPRIEDIKKLRDQTGVSVMQCKKALEETGGDIEKALAVLLSRGSELAAKKADRDLGAGIIESYVHQNGALGALVELSSETDFVARNEDFKELAHEIAMQVAAMNPKFIDRSEVPEEEVLKIRESLSEKGEALEEKVESILKQHILLEQSTIKHPDLRVADLIERAIQKFGERYCGRGIIRISI